MTATSGKAFATCCAVLDPSWIYILSGKRGAGLLFKFSEASVASRAESVFVRESGRGRCDAGR